MEMMMTMSLFNTMQRASSNGLSMTTAVDATAPPISNKTLRRLCMIQFRELNVAIDLSIVMSEIVFIPTGLCLIAQGCRASRLPWGREHFCLVYPNGVASFAGATPLG